MTTRAQATLVLTFAAIATGVALSVTQPVTVAAQKEKPVDRTGLDILCAGKGTYSPPPKQGGTSTCLFKNGDVMTCDTATDKCQVKSDAKSERGINADAMTLFMLRELNEKVDRLSAQVQGLSAAKK